jgi:hypothetical protein
MHYTRDMGSQAARLVAQIERSMKSTPQIVVNSAELPRHTQVNGKVPMVQWNEEQVK